MDLRNGLALAAKGVARGTGVTFQEPRRPSYGHLSVPPYRTLTTEELFHPTRSV